MGKFLALLVSLHLLYYAKIVYSKTIDTLQECENEDDCECDGYEELFASDFPIRSGLCYNNNTLIEIKDNATTPNQTLYTVCHDEARDETLWSQHYIYGSLLSNANETGGSRPFKRGGFYAISPETCYNKNFQFDTMSMLLKTTQYINVSTDYFLSKGHLSPRGDQISRVHRCSTYYYINAHPQWQAINGGNWNELEKTVRELAINTSSIFNVWTGTYGTLNLTDVDGKLTEIWIGRNRTGLVKKIPTNHLTWKVIHDMNRNTGVAAITINNPYIRNVTSNDILCNDVQSQLQWVNWNTANYTGGYTYFCSVFDFHSKVAWAPNLGNIPLLM